MTKWERRWEKRTFVSKKCDKKGQTCVHSDLCCVDQINVQCSMINAVYNQTVQLWITQSQEVHPSLYSSLISAREYSTNQRNEKIESTLKTYKIQIVHHLLPPDKVQRKAFSQWIINMCRDDNDFLEHLIASDEAHFNLSGHVDKQNIRFGARENPQKLHEKPLHSEKVTVWCAMTPTCVIGPYFFKDGQGAPVTITAERYNNMLNDFFIPELQRLQLTNMWMQQNGATSHTARISMATLQRQFPGRLISRFGDIS